MYTIIINGLSEKSAKIIKEGIEEKFPILDEKVIIYKEPEIKPLNEAIEDFRRKERG